MSEDDDVGATFFDPVAIGTQLEKILASPEFLNAGRVKRLLAFVVSRSLAGQADSLNEYVLAFEVFEESDHFDPDKNSIVRTSFKRLRKRLEAYYAGTGVHDELLIDLPKGYIPKFRQRVPNPVISGAKAWIPSARRRRYMLMAAVAAMLVGVSAWIATRSHSAVGVPSPESRPRRIFARATAEGGAPIRALGGQRYGQLLPSANGEKLYAMSIEDDRAVTVVGIHDLQVKAVIRSPISLREGSMSLDRGLLYVGSPEAQVLVIDTDTDQVKAVIPVGGPTFDVVAAEDGRKLFLAMGLGGLKRMDLVSGEIRVLSPIVHPTHLVLDHAKKRLYVAYNNGGPGGRPGHDVVDVYDVESERSLYQFANLPMVGGHPVLSAKDEVILLDARDACFEPRYDHQGCPAVPSHPIHLFRLSDHRLVASVVLDGWNSQGVAFPEGTRMLLLGHTLAVWDWARRKTVEEIPSPGTGWVAIAPSGDRAFASLTDGGIMLFLAERSECLPPIRGLVNYYAADGTLEDAHGNGVLDNHGATFTAGRMGQGMRFDGTSSYLGTYASSAYCPSCRDSWTEGFFVKFDSDTHEMTVLETAHQRRILGRRVSRTLDRRLVLESYSGQVPKKVAIASRNELRNGRWYHVAVVADRDRHSLYVDGELQGQHQILPPDPFIGMSPVFIGSTQGKRDFFKGLIDEYVIYNRALSADEIRALAATEGCGMRR